MQFEDILRQIGDEGRYQFWISALLLLPTSFFNAFFDSIILMATPDHWCYVPGLEQLPQDVQHQLIRPVDNATGKGASCLRYDIDYTGFSSMDDLRRYTKFNNYTNLASIPTVACSQGYLYDQSLYAETATSWVRIL